MLPFMWLSTWIFCNGTGLAVSGTMRPKSGGVINSGHILDKCRDGRTDKASKRCILVKICFRNCVCIVAVACSDYDLSGVKLEEGTWRLRRTKIWGFWFWFFFAYSAIERRKKGGDVTSHVDDWKHSIMTEHHSQFSNWKNTKIRLRTYIFLTLPSAVNFSINTLNSQKPIFSLVRSN